MKPPVDAKRSESNTDEHNKFSQVSKNFNEFLEIDGNLLREIYRNLLSVFTCINL
jgi:hypothetical protein